MWPELPLRTARFLVLAGALFIGSVIQGCSGTRPHVIHSPGYPIGFIERGEASWYGPGFHGKRTANGEQYDMYKLTAAHRTLPLGSVAVVRSLTSGHRVTVRINDRGPYARGRVLDLSLAGARALGMTGKGTDRIELRVVDYTPRSKGMGVLRIQIGSFADLPNARALFERIRSEYSGGRIAQVDLPEGRRYRVQVGQFMTESEAHPAAVRLERKFNLQSLVVRDDG